MSKDIRRCRCCNETYEKGGDEMHCVIPDMSVEKKGFCGFCDRNNTSWYTPQKKCHNEKG